MNIYGQTVYRNIVNSAAISTVRILLINQVLRVCLHSLRVTITFLFKVGISAEGKVFVVVGSTRLQPVACAEWSMAELRQVKVGHISSIPLLPPSPPSE